MDENKPVAWVKMEEGAITHAELSDGSGVDMSLRGWTPLYTAPPKQSEQEPPTVAELLCVCGAGWAWRNRDWELVETPSPQREWIGLADEDIAEGAKQSWVDKQAFESAVWWAEEKLKEKNCG